MNPIFRRILGSVRLYAIMLAAFIFASQVFSEESSNETAKNQPDFISIDGKIPEFFQNLDLQKLKQESGIQYLNAKDELKHFHVKWYYIPHKRTIYDSWIESNGNYFSKNEGYTTFVKGDNVYLDSHDAEYEDFEKTWAKKSSCTVIGRPETNLIRNCFMESLYSFPREVLTFYQQKNGLILASILRPECDIYYYVFDAKTRLLVKRESFNLEGEKEDNIKVDFSPIPEAKFDITPDDSFKELFSNVIFSGSVVDENGTPVPDCKVIMEPSFFYHFNTITEKDGRFEYMLAQSLDRKGLKAPILIKAFSEKHPDQLAWAVICTNKCIKYNHPKKFNELFADFGASHDGEIKEAYNKVPDFSKKDEYRRYGIKSCRDMKLVLRKAGSIKGKVTDATGRPVAGAEVWLHSFKSNYKQANKTYTPSLDKDTDEFTLYPSSNAEMLMNQGNPRTLFLDAGDMPDWKVKTDEDGTYEIKRLPTGDIPRKFIVYCKADDYAIERKTVSFESKQEKGDASFSLYKSDLVIRRKLTDDSGKPIPYYPVILARGKKPVNYLGGYTDENGLFAILKAPRYPDLSVTLPEANIFEKIWYMEKIETVYAPVFAEVKPREGQREYTVNLIAKRPTHTIEVTVKDENGKPIPYCEVWLKSELIYPGFNKKKNLFVALSDKKGICRFERVPIYKKSFVEIKFNTEAPDYLNLPKEISEDEKQLRKKKYISGMGTCINLPANKTLIKNTFVINFSHSYKQAQKYPSGDPDIF